MRAPASLVAVVLIVAAPAAAAAAPPTGAANRGRDVAATVRWLDGQMAARWAAAGVTPAPDASDAEFLRRVSLDLIGRIPSPGEALAFLDDRSPDRRERLVDRLLASPDYAEHWADVYTDLLVGRDIRLRRRLSEDARAWLRDAFAANLPYDQMVEQILTATGRLEGNGAAAFIVNQQRKAGTVEGVAAETARVFLGLQLQCARCHDHPTDKRYKRQTFADFTAFFGEVRVRRWRGMKGPGALEIVDLPLAERARRGGDLARRKAKQPDLAYALLEPRWFAREVDARPGETRRQRVARAVLSSDLLAKAAVNRTWNSCFGHALTPTWDDLGAERDPSHPALLTGMADDFAASGHDLARLLKVIVLSRAYRRSSAGPVDRRAPAEAAFALAAVRPLSADQLFRSLVTAGGLRDRPSPYRRLREFLFTFNDDEEREVDAFSGSVSQALLLLNGDLANLAASRRRDLALGRILVASPEPRQRIEWLYLAALARRPTDPESERARAYLAARRDNAAGYEDLFHALLTSVEFTTNH